MRRRVGFTLVELLVAMALIIFIMAILSEAFSAGFKAFRDLKALGDMNERLRTASNSLRKYIGADHFEGRKRLSDPNFWQNGPPLEGFFRIEQDSASTNEGTSNTLVTSFRATTHRLHFTAKLRGNARGEWFPATVPASVTSTAMQLNQPLRTQAQGYRDLTDAYHAQWVEVQVFLRPTEVGISETGTTAGQLYALHLRAKALVPEGVVTGTSDLTVNRSDMAALADFSLYDHAGSGNVYVNTPTDVTIPARRSLAFRTLAEDAPTRAGADVLLPDVLSMAVRVLVDGRNDFVDLADLDATWPQQGASPPAVFDTWTQNSQVSLGLPDYGNPVDSANPPNPNPNYWSRTIPRHVSSGNVPIRVKAIQITLRVWDTRTEQTRQVSIVVDL